MGIVSKQAISNSIFSFIGIAAGALNTIFILPRAFENTPDDLGLIRILLAYASVIGVVMGFGQSNLIIREHTEINDSSYKRSVLGYGLILSFTGLLILILLFSFYPGVIDHFLNEKEAHRLLPYLSNLLLLCMVIIFTQYFSAYIVSINKSPFVQLIQDPFLKISYLILAVAYLYEGFSFEVFLGFFVGIYIASIIALAVYAFANGFKPKINFKPLKIWEFITYGFYTVLDKGATVIVNNLDLVMIGYLLNLSDVGYYSIAFFIGAVIIVPQRAIMAPSYPMVAKFFKSENETELVKLYKQTSINQLIAGGIIFSLIWVNIDFIFSLMPDNFAPGKWVVFYIGISKLFMLSTGISGAIIIFSKYYKVNLILNLLLILLTISSNYILIPQYGIMGAAIATAITYGVYNLMKIIYISFKFGYQPFNLNTIKAALILALTTFLCSQIELGINTFIETGIKSICAGALLLVLFIIFKVKAEILEMIPFFKNYFQK